MPSLVWFGETFGALVWGVMLVCGSKERTVQVAELLFDYRHSAAQHSTAQHSTAQHSTAQHSTAQHSTAQHSTAQHSTAQHSTAQHSTAQHSTAQHSIPQHTTAQHSTAQRSAARSPHVQALLHGHLGFWGLPEGILHLKQHDGARISKPDVAQTVECRCVPGCIGCQIVVG